MNLILAAAMFRLVVIYDGMTPPEIVSFSEPMSEEQCLKAAVTLRQETHPAYRIECQPAGGLSV